MKWLYTSSLIRLYNLCPPSVNSFSLSLSFFFRFILLVQCPPPTFACMPSLLPITSSFSLFSYKAASALFLHTRHMHRVHKRLSTARCNKLHNWEEHRCNKFIFMTNREISRDLLLKLFIFKGISCLFMFYSAYTSLLFFAASYIFFF